MPAPLVVEPTSRKLRFVSDSFRPRIGTIRTDLRERSTSNNKLHFRRISRRARCGGNTARPRTVIHLELLRLPPLGLGRERENNCRFHFRTIGYTTGWSSSLSAMKPHTFREEPRPEIRGYKFGPGNYTVGNRIFNSPSECFAVCTPRETFQSLTEPDQGPTGGAAL